MKMTKDNLTKYKIANSALTLGICIQALLHYEWVWLIVLGGIAIALNNIKTSK